MTEERGAELLGAALGFETVVVVVVVVGLHGKLFISVNHDFVELVINGLLLLLLVMVLPCCCAGVPPQQ